MLRKQDCVWIAALVVCTSQPCHADHPAAGFGHGIAGPVVTIPAAALPAGKWTVGARLELVRFDPFSDQALEAAALADEDLHSTDHLLSPSLAVGYGVTSDLTVGARLPHVLRSAIREGHLEGGVPEVHSHGDSKGVGDLTVLAQYRFVRAPEGLSAALLAGVELPTGQTDATGEGGERFEVEHQPGSGSTDPLVGLAGSLPAGKLSLDASLLATLSMEGSEDTNLGTLLNYNFAASFRPGAGHEHAGEQEQRHVALDLVLEANGEWRDRMEVAGIEDSNSGGTLVYLSPGVRLGNGGGWSVSGSVGIPVLQDLNGSQHDTDLRVLVGLGVGF